jgi:hypothetical protein
MPLDPEPIRDILYRLTIRYLNVRPEGLELDRQVVPAIEGKILSFGGARTLYRGRKPQCRSLDGFRAIKGQLCSQCPELKNCTSQVRVELLIRERPYRLLLAYSSAKHFLIYTGKLKRQGFDPEKVKTRIAVINRGTWGELLFSQVE